MQNGLFLLETGATSQPRVYLEEFMKRFSDLEKIFRYSKLYLSLR